MADQTNRDGKRKAYNTQPVASVSEPRKTTTSNPNMGKGTKGKNSRSKTKQKAVSLVGSQPNGVGLSFKYSEAHIGLDKGFMSRDGDNQGPFVFSSPPGIVIYTEAEAEAEVNKIETSNSKKKIPIGQITDTSTAEENVRIISNRIKHSDFRKIVDSGRGGMGSNSVYSEETDEMRDDGQGLSGKNDPSCGDNDQWDNPDKGGTSHTGVHQTLHNFTPTEVGVEDGFDGGIEIERH